MPAGYSGTPLWKKLGLKEGMTLYYEGLPDDVWPLIAEEAPATQRTDMLEEADLLHLFTTKEAQITSLFDRALPAMKRDTMIWVSWPKKAAKIPTDVTEDTIRTRARSLGLVDVKVCAVTDIWSGLKLVIRKELR